MKQLDRIEQKIDKLTEFVKPRELLTVSQAAEFLGVHINTVKAWENEGQLKASITPGGHRRFDREELERFQKGEK